jgi:hypothetical protein
MNILKQNLTSLCVFSILGIGQFSFAQEVKYKVVENTPYTHVLNIGISPLDFKLVGGEPMGGPAVSVAFRPISRLKVDANLASGIYVNDASGQGGIKGAGGIFADGGVSYMWQRAGKNFVRDKESTTPISKQFNLKGEYTGVNQTTVTYVKFPYNRMVERGLRAGGFYYDFPLSEGLSSSAGAYLGISKTSFNAATLDVEGYGTLSRFESIGYNLDILFGGSTYFPGDEPAEAGNLGFRFGFNMFYKGGIFPLTVGFEAGSLPGAGGFMGVRFAGNIAKGKQSYKGDYKSIKKAKKSIPALMQAIW